MQIATVAFARGEVRHGWLSMPRKADRDHCAAKAYLSHDAVERALFDRLERAHGRHYRLIVNHRNDDHFDPATDTIAWDPHSALRTTCGGRQSPALGLGHEIDHAVESRAREAALAARSSRAYDTAEERRVITGSERHAARTLGEGVRHDQRGSCYRVASPTRIGF
jgi:ribosome modulation factor